MPKSISHKIFQEQKNSWISTLWKKSTLLKLFSKIFMQNYDDERSSYVDTRDENVHIISGRRIKLFKNSIEIVPEPRMLGKHFNHLLDDKHF